MRRTMRKLHEWIGIGVGVLFAIWLVSGIVMVLPFGDRAAYEGPYGPTEYTQASVSPAAAVQAAASTSDTEALATAVRLKRFDDGLVYIVTLAEGGNRMIDVATGLPVEITSDMAERLAIAEFGTDAPVAEVRLMTEREAAYAFGPLPAWRVAFDDARSSVSYVALSDGSIRRADRITRLRGAIVGAHTFDFLAVLKLGGAQATLILILTSVISMVAVATGYYLFIDKTVRNRQRRRQAPPEAL